jgi:GAF domain-containing protein
VGERIVELPAAVAGIRWSHVYPLTVGGRVAGSLSFHGPEELSALVQNVCEAFAEQASLTIENAQLVAQERQRAARAERLAAVLADVGAAVDLESALSALLRGAVALLDGARGSADVFDGATGERLLKMRLEPDESIDVLPRPGPPGTEGYGRRVMDERRAQVLEDFQLLRPDQGLWRERGMRATIYAPILAGGNAIGSFHVDHPAPGHFTRAEALLAEALGAQAGEVIERARLAEAVRTEQLERARLDGALLVARTTAHEINNALAPVVGYAELLTMQSGLGPAAARYAADILAGAMHATERVRQLQRIVRLDESSMSPGGQSLLDLDRSTAPEAAG